MKRICSVLVGSGLLLSVAAPLLAQQAPSDAPPPVLVVQLERLKPGRAGNMHEKSESAFVRAMTAAKWPTHYLAATSLSGEPRALFFTGYGSFADWEKDNQAVRANPTLAKQIDDAMVADGDLLTSYVQGVLAFNKEMSNGTEKVSIGNMRYWEISLFKVKPGHAMEFRELVKLYGDALKQVRPDEVWAEYDSVYGENNGGLHLFFSPKKSLSEIDSGMQADEKVRQALGENGMKRVGELEAACVESSQNNLFEFAPKMSYPRDSWVKADPAFWSGK